MKTKPMLILAAALLCCAAFFARCNRHSVNNEALNSFLNLINLQVQNKQTKSLMQDFAMPKKKDAIRQLINLLCNQTGVSKNSRPIFTVTMNMEANDATVINEKLTKVIIPIKLHRDSIEEQSTTLTFKIKEVANSTFKIVDVDAKDFLGDYIGYENLVRRKTLKDADIYSPQTLAAFKVADKLKAKYDSIPWFQHVDGKTWFFVVKGKFDFYNGMGRDTTHNFKMGLVSPDQKEIIPVDFDLIHNIGATFPNLVEVEKDHKRGFYNLTGEVALPVAYDQIYPLNDDEDLAIVRKGNDYYHWKKGFSLSDADANIKIADYLPRIQAYGRTSKLTEQVMQNVMEHNSRENHGSVYIAPSYMTDWALLPPIQEFKNPLRKNIEYEEVSTLYELQFEGKEDNASWLASAFYSIRDNYIGGRGDLYVHNNVLVINKKNNRVYGHDLLSYLNESEGDGAINGKCNVNSLKPINDSLFEVTIGSSIYRPMYNDRTVDQGTEYHYLVIRNDKLEDLPNNRLFGFTKYVKMDDSYLKGCYEFSDANNKNPSSTDHITPDLLRYMKNEIYAEYKYRFKDKKWAEVFGWDKDQDDKYHDNVDDSLTVIDKYNINFINQKLKSTGGQKLAAK
ncbi:YARHG domain-containing protein [Mucilaginibacter mali]|uniref:YARHG domain-containing protein n=1 Tax=Mucilaginibacter mali TaxID=2740462 RepID=A0A7D4UD45_9SPHI|nr:YARHG domain-containing protein [Mucilaginibacter mali]QKJ32278.1 YARHG domain-containing protein [Mucilaginibacter mali]